MAAIVRAASEAQGASARGTLAGTKAVVNAIHAAKDAWIPSDRAQRFDALCARATRDDRALGALDKGAGFAAPGLANPGPWVGGSLFPSGIPVGVNHVLFDAGLSKFGTTSEQLDDLEDLGASFARHVASVDVTWRALTGSIMTPIPATYGEIVAMVFGDADSNLTALRTFFAAARSRGIKVVLTTPMHAGGPDNRWTPADRYTPEAWTSGLKANFTPFILDDADRPLWFDPYNEDKLLRVVWICQAVGDLLTAAGAGRDVVLAVEGFNEVNTRNVFESDPVASGYSWGLVHYQCARALRATAPDLPISLPSLASYVLATPRGGRIDTWEQTVDFLDAMALAVVESSRLDGVDPSSLAAGVDYHWYLAAQTGIEDRGLVDRHIGHMIAEVETLRMLLRSHTGLEAAEVGVLETGASANIGAPAIPPLAELPQAHEVWRRIGGALAAGVHRAAWHTWMSTEASEPSASFAEFGLRRDLGPDDEPASSARPRRSWAAFWQLTRVLRVRRGRMLTLNPADFAGPSFFPGEASVPPGLLIAGLVIFEYVLVGDGYAYLVLVDRSAGEDRSYDVSSSSSVFTEYPTVPSMTSRSTGGLPVASVSSSPATTVGPLTFRMEGGAAPRVFQTPRRVTWSVRLR